MLRKELIAVAKHVAQDFSEPHVRWRGMDTVKRYVAERVAITPESVCVEDAVLKLLEAVDVAPPYIRGVLAGALLHATRALERLLAEERAEDGRRGLGRAEHPQLYWTRD